MNIENLDRAVEIKNELSGLEHSMEFIKRVSSTPAGLSSVVDCGILLDKRDPKHSGNPYLGPQKLFLTNDEKSAILKFILELQEARDARLRVELEEL